MTIEDHNEISAGLRDALDGEQAITVAALLWEISASLRDCLATANPHNPADFLAALMLNLQVRAMAHADPRSQQTPTLPLSR